MPIPLRSSPISLCELAARLGHRPAQPKAACQVAQAIAPDARVVHVDNNRRKLRCAHAEDNFRLSCLVSANVDESIWHGHDTVPTTTRLRGG
jgi:hypothetical protein